MTVTLDNETASQLSQAAKLRGFATADMFAIHLLKGAINESLFEMRNDPIDESERIEIEDAVEAGVADERAGRIKSLDQVLAEVRTKYGFPADFGLVSTK